MELNVSIYTYVYAMLISSHSTFNMKVCMVFLTPKQKKKRKEKH